MRRGAAGHRGDPRRRPARDGRGDGRRRHRRLSGPPRRPDSEAVLGAGVESGPMSGRYVALGSSMAAGPGIRPHAPGAPFGSGRSARNYAHLVAERLNLDLVDVTFSGATTAHVLAERQRGAPPQIEALDGSEELVTITIGGNDVGYVPLLMAASLPADGIPAAPLSAEHADLGRFVGAGLEEATAAAAHATGCELVRAGHASRDHHGWSTDSW